MKKLKKILLVDDDKVNNYVNESLLKDLQIAETICIEMNGEKAIQHLTFHCESENGIRPQIVILDHFMPVMDGLEMMSILNNKGFVDKYEIVYILLGVNSTNNAIQEFKKLGVQEFTNKPLTEKTVMDAYHKYFAGDTAGDHNA